jgi:hypothetical protein
MNQSLAMQKQESDNTINQNKQYLTDQIAKLNTQRNQNADHITALQNRRGGFYSGGLDYQLAQNNTSINNSQGQLTRDINTKNMEIGNRYNLIASQAAEQIRQMENQSSEKIRELVNQEIERQRQEATAAAKARAKASKPKAAPYTPPTGKDLVNLYSEYLASKGEPTAYMMTPNEVTKRTTNVYAGMENIFGQPPKKSNKKKK